MSGTVLFSVTAHNTVPPLCTFLQEVWYWPKSLNAIRSSESQLAHRSLSSLLRQHLVEYVGVHCAAVYNFLLQRVSQFIKEAIVGEQSAADTAASTDSDDVLYHFCGASLASMLHSRYKLIRTCPLERKDAISQEISLLQSINSKGKSHIPNYLQYRDRGFMYFPSEQFFAIFTSCGQKCETVHKS